ncbi:SVAGG family GlyGly-CTERM protein [Aeromonas hydrophila]|uniref:SVAGG family GlyGly-CTERM protein n=1 Tax=Aeromonas hydrophila TaxID=644 RepID=UPI001FF2C1EE|nr:SVAGG family GlyGly-CTERM protein [Aeromonas hydrophila]MCK0188014.1 SVAGG family GlyGly-CTERM protein [Aeromonas hydrophila]UOV93229.1 SVAGG family GlyGly-CTERM protein [Aeromonas hydrophila]
MKGNLIALSLLLATRVATATTTIDVNFMVPQAMADSQGREALFAGLRASLDKVDEFYLSKYTGITRNGKAEDIHFNLRQILVLSDKTADAECLDGLVHTAMVLYQDGQIATKDNVLPSESGYDTACISPDDAEAIRLAGRSSGADFWVTLHDGFLHGYAIGLARGQMDAEVKLNNVTTTGSYYAPGSLAHEFLHFFGGVDLYNKPENALCESDGAWSGRLMCRSPQVPNTNLFGSTRYLDEKLFLQRFYDRADSTMADWTYNGINRSRSAFKASGAAVMTAPASGNRVASLKASGNTLSREVPFLTLSVRVKGAGQYEQPVAVEIYTQGVTAKAGDNYFDDVTQTLMFDPGNPDYEVTADGSWVKTLRLTSKNLDFKGSKTLLVGLRGGNATAADAAQTTISIARSSSAPVQGEPLQSNNTVAGAGTSSPPVLLGLACLAWWRRKFRSLDLRG